MRLVIMSQHIRGAHILLCNSKSSHLLFFSFVPLFLHCFRYIDATLHYVSTLPVLTLCYVSATLLARTWDRCLFCCFANACFIVDTCDTEVTELYAILGSNNISGKMIREHFTFATPNSRAVIWYAEHVWTPYSFQAICEEDRRKKESRKLKFHA